MAAYCQVYGVIHLQADCPVHRDQLRAQRSVTSMGKLYLFTDSICSQLYTGIVRLLIHFAFMQESSLKRRTAQLA